MGYFRTHALVGWDPFRGSDAVVLTVIPIALAATFAFVGTRLQSPVGVRSPGPTVGGFMIAIWALAVCTLVAAIHA
jgi:hypothetical protein